MEAGIVTHHGEFAGEYRLIEFGVPGIAAAVRPGQFVHVRITGLEPESLRRPFSVYRAGNDTISVLYKCVGRGTAVLAKAVVGDAFSLIGPLGNGFPDEEPSALPVLVAGGYGVAPLSFLARNMGRTGVVFLGGRTDADILCANEFTDLNWDVRVSTEDGSSGLKGLVTDAFDAWLAEYPCDDGVALYACGPEGMLRAVGDRAIRAGWPAWLSMDKNMGCGIGACLACVVRVRDADGKESWARSCREGPVFEARSLAWDETEAAVSVERVEIG